jgi:hypothetical protein
MRVATLIITDFTEMVMASSDRIANKHGKKNA